MINSASEESPIGRYLRQVESILVKEAEKTGNAEVERFLKEEAERIYQEILENIQSHEDRKKLSDLYAALADEELKFSKNWNPGENQASLEHLKKMLGDDPQDAYRLVAKEFDRVDDEVIPNVRSYFKQKGNLNYQGQVIQIPFDALLQIFQKERHSYMGSEGHDWEYKVFCFVVHSYLRAIASMADPEDMGEEQQNFIALMDNIRF